LTITRCWIFIVSREPLLTIAAHRRQVKVDLGVLDISEDSRIVDYHEKPETTYSVSMGIYVYEPEVLNWIQPGEYLDLPSLVLRLIRTGRKFVPIRRTASGWISAAPMITRRAQELFAGDRGQFETL
jgi:NDP-sugar pyrophosphorylase family protein